MKFQKGNTFGFKKGNQFWKQNVGKHHTEETKRKISESHKGYKVSKETKKKLSEALKGKGKGKKLSSEIKLKISLSKKGKKLSEEHKIKLSKAKIGEKNGSWKGGISFEPYSIDWTKTLKRSIRERDKYTCQICGKEPATHCHHIDYDKKNCNPDNLITLCKSCHAKTNQNRNYWIKYFNS